MRVGSAARANRAVEHVGGPASRTRAAWAIEHGHQPGPRQGQRGRPCERAGRPSGVSTMPRCSPASRARRHQPARPAARRRAGSARRQASQARRPAASTPTPGRPSSGGCGAPRWRAAARPAGSARTAGGENAPRAGSRELRAPKARPRQRPARRGRVRVGTRLIRGQIRYPRDSPVLRRTFDAIRVGGGPAGEVWPAGWPSTG